MSVLLSALLACSRSTPAPAVAPPAPEPPRPSAVVVTINKTAQGDPEGEQAPSTVLSMTLSGGMSDTFELITAEGSCSDAGEPPLLAELHCWWAGAGDIVRIQHTDGAIVVTHAGIGEGMEGEPEFTEIQRVAVPDGLTVKMAE